MRIVLALALTSTLLLGACGGATSKHAAPTTTTSTSTSTSTSGQPPTTHVVWIWMENHSYSQVIGSSAAPYETALARQFGTATHYSSVGSPSLPNYIGATSGSTHGIGDDAGPQTHALTSDNIFRQVRAAGGIERSFTESMPINCALSSVDTYAVKHNPAAYYTGGNDRAACGVDDVSFSSTLPRGRLPMFSFVTPNLCHDTHDCSVGVGDAWLRSFLPPLLASAEYRAGKTVIFLIWDEYSPMPNVVISPTTPPGTVSTQP
ncbi:MAG: hypothetical protein JOZ68_15085, partial [Acidimicrobiia bacterium]|nr:hypothetical protein [Acidimicrobiia bacterium]